MALQDSFTGFLSIFSILHNFSTCDIFSLNNLQEGLTNFQSSSMLNMLTSIGFPINERNNFRLLSYTIRWS